MAITLVGTSFAGATLNPAQVVSDAQGDVYVAFTESHDDAATTFTAPSGNWVAKTKFVSTIATTIYTSVSQVWVLVRGATAGTDFGTWSASGSTGGGSVTYAVFRGANQTSPLDSDASSPTFSQGGTAGPMIGSSISLAGSTGKLLMLGVTVATSSTPTGMSADTGGTDGDGLLVSVFEQDIASSGATGSRTSTFTPGSFGWVAVMLALAPAAPSPTITAQPSRTAVYAGQTATFTITASSSGGTLHYQWEVNGSNVGADSSTYTTGSLALSDNGSLVTCVVTDDNGNVTSNVALLTVFNSARTAWLV